MTRPAEDKTVLSMAESYRRATFRAATKGLRAYDVGRALTNRAWNWRGSTKRDLEENFIHGFGNLNMSGQDLRARLAYFRKLKSRGSI